MATFLLADIGVSGSDRSSYPPHASERRFSSPVAVAFLEVLGISGVILISGHLCPYLDRSSYLGVHG